MNFGQLCDQVGILTGRADLASEIQLAVRRATLWLHGIDTWFRDLNEKRLPFDALAYKFSVDTTAVMTNFRKISYIKILNTDGTVAGDIHFCSPSNLWDEFGREKNDIWYVAGKNLNFKTKNAASSFLLAYYTYPNVVDAFSSWIADIYPYAIIEEAAGRVLHMVGQIDEGNKFVDPKNGSVFTTHIPWLRTNCITPEAY